MTGTNSINWKKREETPDLLLLLQGSLILRSFSFLFVFSLAEIIFVWSEVLGLLSSSGRVVVTDTIATSQSSVLAVTNIFDYPVSEFGELFCFTSLTFRVPEFCLEQSLFCRTALL